MANSLDIIRQNAMLAAKLGRHRRVSEVYKFGQATDCDAGVDTDIWSRANSTDAESTWVAPTQARTHQITSTSTSDTSDGAGARTIRIYGLTDWDTAEVSEDITMDGAALA